MWLRGFHHELPPVPTSRTHFCGIISSPSFLVVPSESSRTFSRIIEFYSAWYAFNCGELIREQTWDHFITNILSLVFQIHINYNSDVMIEVTPIIGKNISLMWWELNRSNYHLLWKRELVQPSVDTYWWRCLYNLVTWEILFLLFWILKMAWNRKRLILEKNLNRWYCVQSIIKKTLFGTKETFLQIKMQVD